MKRNTNRIPTYIFMLVAVLASWGVALAKTIVTQSYPELSAGSLPWGGIQYQYIFAFLFQ